MYSHMLVDDINNKERLIVKDWPGTFSACFGAVLARVVFNRRLCLHEEDIAFTIPMLPQWIGSSTVKDNKKRAQLFVYLEASIPKA